MLSSAEAVIAAERPIGIDLLGFRCRAREFWASSKSHVSDESGLYSNDEALRDTVLDLIASLQLVPAARFLPSRSRHGSLSGQLALLFHRVDTEEYGALTLVPLLTAVMELKPDVDVWELAYLSTQQHHRHAQPESYRASNSNTLSESVLQHLVQCIIKAEARSVLAEERLKQMKATSKLVPGLIELLGTDAAKTAWSLVSEVHDDIELLSEDSSWAEFPRESQSRVLQTPELLEQILLHLLLDILHCQRVCGHWKDVIDSSPMLQQALYFRPTPIGRKDNEVGLTIQNQRSNIFNPLLQEVFIEWFNASSYFDPYRTEKR